MGSIEEHNRPLIDAFIEAVSSLPYVVRVDARETGFSVGFHVVVSSTWHEASPAVAAAVASLPESPIQFRYTVSQEQWAPPPSQWSVFVKAEARLRQVG